jgi:hypothetical protein
MSIRIQFLGGGLGARVGTQATASSMATQHMRIYFLGAHLVEIGLTQVQIAESPGGANILTGAMTYTASSSRTGSPDNLQTGAGDWAPTDLIGSWWQVDFGGTFTPAEMKLTARSGGLFHQAPTAFMVATGTSASGPWTPRQIFSSHGAFTTNGEIKTFTLDGGTLTNDRAQARIWIIDVTNTNHTDGRVGLYEFEAYTTVGGSNVISNLTNGAVVSEPSNNALDPADQIDVFPYRSGAQWL